MLIVYIKEYLFAIKNHKSHERNWKILKIQTATLIRNNEAGFNPAQLMKEKAESDSA